MAKRRSSRNLIFRVICDVIIGVRCSGKKYLFQLEIDFCTHKSQMFFSQVLSVVLDTGRVCEDSESQVLVIDL
jgi:hypothetical protein